jgi:hypothetical protein
MNPIENIILKNQPKFETWEHQLGEHLLLQYEPGAVEAEADRERIFFQTNELLISIAENFFSYGKFKDKWDTSKCSLFPLGQYILLRSEKMDINFIWGIELNNFYLETFIIYPENLRFMNDDFWAALLEMKGLGEFQYSVGGLNAEERRYFENKTSTVFQMIRTFMLYQVNQSKAAYSDHNYLDLGTLTIKWPMSNNWANLLQNTCNAFRLLYNLNYQLWKISDLASKKIK